MWGLMVWGVEVRVCTDCIMGCDVMIGAPVSERDTGNGICMIPWGMVTIGPAWFMMVGICATVDEMCISMLFCSGRGRGREQVSHNSCGATVNSRCTPSHRHANNFLWYAQPCYCAITSSNDRCCVNF